MGSRILLIVADCFIPALMLLMGIWMTVRPPKMNMLIGYRTERSMQNQETWEFANKRFGRIWMVTALILIAAAAFVIYATLEQGKIVQGLVSIVLVTVQMILLFVTMIPVEASLKKKFPETSEEENLEK